MPPKKEDQKAGTDADLSATHSGRCFAKCSAEGIEPGAASPSGRSLLSSPLATHAGTELVEGQAGYWGGSAGDRNKMCSSDMFSNSNDRF